MGHFVPYQHSLLFSKRLNESQRRNIFEIIKSAILEFNFIINRYTIPNMLDLLIKTGKPFLIFPCEKF